MNLQLSESEAELLMTEIGNAITRKRAAYALAQAKGMTFTERDFAIPQLVELFEKVRQVYDAN